MLSTIVGDVVVYTRGIVGTKSYYTLCSVGRLDRMAFLSVNQLKYNTLWQNWTMESLGDSVVRWVP